MPTVTEVTVGGKTDSGTEVTIVSSAEITEEDAKAVFSRKYEIASWTTEEETAG
ncbi:MAG: hypothetical protein AAF191_10075 [Verrucomicrobiota bacterium]